MSRIPQSQRLRDQLEDAIVEGLYAPGDRLDPEALASEYQCSRTPVREALQQLATTGMVEVKPKRGTFVARLNVMEVVERFEVMAELEGMCGRLAARRITSDELTALEAAHEACRQARDAGDSDEYYYRNGVFHECIYTASHNDFLAKEALRLHAMLKPYRRLQLHVRNRVKDSFDEHERIVHALRSGDAETARRELMDHVRLQGDRFNDMAASIQRLPPPRA
ncbi:GntR family transcriptional regulator [Larsenimonas rhizosphaerae]|uniref:GntR family transcriptional regulator n=1 Tax=Larsenimonas rhizosphaerae TaxID=2944682 RepID=UPI00203363A6|nr:GntR family transcriptional regulator [Larsenimonas rhizosphaerae]MCM2129762.1 GntR family transcriptional regulator [Larsenimonas rhizosphaerae]